MLKIEQADAYAADTNALLIAEGAASDAAEALALSGVRLRTHTDFAHATPHIGGGALDLILIETASASPDQLDIVLARADAMARDEHMSILVAMAPDQLDLAAHLFGPHSQLLCEPSLSERVAAIALARARRWQGAALHDVTREPESIRLQRLNEEVARIADTLARLTRGEPQGSVRDPGNSYRGPADEYATGETSAAEIRALIRSRRLRGQFFPADLFADPAWDMLLDLFAATLEKRRVSVSSLCIAAAVPPTTALRWIGTMHENGLFERQADPSDRRRAYIALSAKGLEGMRSYVAAAKRAGLALA
ncbi:winged helix DNA-binding protein [Sphingomonas soli]|uniref:winged helix DNA-binding protein n=1 Tax=Sphingomonas soli TaxID=266127 RepID=UPI00082C2875|nr:winged helix DNA-binding protein [Sphingomonas soli]